MVTNDLPVLKLTDRIAATLAALDCDRPYSTAIAVARAITLDELVAEVRRRGGYVIGRPEGVETEGADE